jgi:hypothetical protein
MTIKDLPDGFLGRQISFAESPTRAVVQAVVRSQKGGMIVFPVGVSGTVGIAALAFAKAWVGSLGRKPNRRSLQAMRDAGVPSTFCLRKYFRGRYRSQAGSVYNKRSLTMEVLCLTKQEVIKLATALTENFHLASVLVKDHASGKVYIVDGKLGHRQHW